MTQNDRSPDTTSLYAWLSRDVDGIEGIVTVPTAAGMLPLVVADRERAERMVQAATLAGVARGFPARLVRFERVEVLQETQP